MASDFVVKNPKRMVSTREWSAGWYYYYAGYSPEFAKALLESSGLRPHSVVVDPWNGSGTTTEIASALGFRAHGYDLNPTMLVVSKARLLGGSTRPSIRPLATRIVKLAKETIPPLLESDQLQLWFSESSVANIRRLDAAIQEILIDQKEYRALRDRDLPSELSDIAAFFYNALFRTVRHQLHPFLSSNPTWIRKAGENEDKLTCGIRLLLKEFENQVDGMLKASEDVLFCHFEADYVLETASSTKLPLEDSSAQLILSSPPYCTRIDYAVATLPELAILGYSKSDVRNLRDRLIGTTTIQKSGAEAHDAWGATCRRFLNRVKSHESKASSTYYYKNHVQYFQGMSKSIEECARILVPGGKCVLVVQDSFYKDVHNKLPRIINEMARNNGLKLERQVDYKQSRTLAGVNPGVKNYRSSFGAIESVLIFQAAS